MQRRHACFRLLSALPLLAAGLLATPVLAEPDQPAAPTEDDATRRGRIAFARGLGLAEEEQWGRALEAFHEAAAARDSAVVQFNIAVCLRALGRYVAARGAIHAALRDGVGLTPPQIEDAKGYLREFGELIATVKIALVPASAKLSIDGRDLVLVDHDLWAAGVGGAGDGTQVGKREFTVMLDAGLHVFRATRPGHADAVVRRTLRSGAMSPLNLDLARLPATLRIQSRPGGGIVTIDGREVGLAPVEVERKAGRYAIGVLQDDFETYTATVDVSAGQRTELTAELEPYSAPLYERWWFWTAAASVVAAGVVATWAATRSEPEPPPYDGGTTGWVVQGAVIRF